MNLIYGAYGRQPTQAILEAYQAVLADRSDYQVESAMRMDMSTPGPQPIGAAELRRLAGNWPSSAGQEATPRRARITQPTAERFFSVREAMRDECRKIIASSDEDPNRVSWCERMLVRLDAQPAGSNPVAALREDFVA